MRCLYELASLNARENTWCLPEGKLQALFFKTRNGRSVEADPSQYAVNEVDASVKMLTPLPDGISLIGLMI